MSTPTQVLRDIFKGIANAIRRKDGTTEAADKIEPTDFASRIDAITTGPDTSDATATADDIASGRTAYVSSGKITGTLSPLITAWADTNVTVSKVGEALLSTGTSSTLLGINKKTIAFPTLTIKVETPLNLLGNATAADVVSGKTFTSSAGVNITGTRTSSSSSSTPAGEITGTLGTTSGASWSTSDPNRGSGSVSITNLYQTAGYTDGFSNGSIIVSVPANRLLKGRTITPTTSSQSVGSAEDILYGAISVAGDPNLIASNIKNGVSIFGVSGTLSTGVNTSDATASASDIASGKTAYVNGSKITGSLTVVSSGGSISFSSSWGASNLALSGSNIKITSNSDGISSDKIIRTGAKVIFNIPASLFGNATAADVVSGKTFTSSDGVSVSGTANIPVTGTVTGSSVYYVDIPVANASSKTKIYLFPLIDIDSSDSIDGALASTSNSILGVTIDIKNNQLGFLSFDVYRGSNTTSGAALASIIMTAGVSYSPSTSASGTNACNINSTRVRVYRPSGMTNLTFKNVTYF